jgi:hypothetical protein
MCPSLCLDGNQASSAVSSPLSELSSSRTLSYGDEQQPGAGVEGSPGQQHDRIMHVLSGEKVGKVSDNTMRRPAESYHAFFTYLCYISLLSSVDSRGTHEKTHLVDLWSPPRQQTIRPIQFLVFKNKIQIQVLLVQSQVKRWFFTCMYLLVN